MSQNLNFLTLTFSDDWIDDNLDDDSDTDGLRIVDDQVSDQADEPDEGNGLTSYRSNSVSSNQVCLGYVRKLNIISRPHNFM